MTCVTKHDKCDKCEKCDKPDKFDKLGKVYQNRTSLTKLDKFEKTFVINMISAKKQTSVTKYGVTNQYNCDKCDNFDKT